MVSTANTTVSHINFDGSLSNRLLDLYCLLTAKECGLYSLRRKIKPLVVKT
jgi:hypothetical protein